MGLASNSRDGNVGYVVHIVSMTNSSFINLYIGFYIRDYEFLTNPCFQMLNDNGVVIKSIQYIIIL